jgi:hypothetical protein
MKKDQNLFCRASAPLAAVPQQRQAERLPYKTGSSA